MKHSLHVLIRVGSHPGPVRVEAEGCLTAASATDLIRIIDHGARLDGCSRVWVDLFSLDHMDLSGVAALKDHARRHQAVAPHLPRLEIFAPTMPRPCDARVGETAGAPR
ncbi:hypothetical protein [Dietzia lutea]|uniref:STAS domain-containing protein n=1 Tax=Dietzia lutea TaxID=546160 RepID=A0A2S1R3Y8_9ACTN|nr:hypothetical protein [Dietzia lutea]AWH90962.1 hypothetical protein A6035_00820 [Dietzia lutea]